MNVAGLPATAARAVDAENKAALLQITSLSVKGKDPIHAMEVQTNKRATGFDALFYFPRTTPGATAPFSLDDKEVEFSTKFEKLTVKYKFRLKDMVYHSKLEL